ncbi:AI-2E family transporter [Facklamia sp. DSM 111018]|uniref:AI-2E family transporter n=1 Tax=Facklamia lactis TaxID=2749967 RepID=A0ABS0LMC5_9LACT|nr:AI-2E family transporter [Facklamia lactis]MBG9980037.1 AI-2E family transporter [Facklamia lactis]MBG9985283.1 AI-2E family transporter [Facklamia lactis]
MKQIEKLDRIVVRYILLIAGLVLLIFNYQLIFAWIGKLWSVLTPIIAGIAIAYVLNILMVKYEKVLWKKTKKPILLKLRRPFAIMLSFLTIIIVLLFVLGLVIPQVYNVFSEAVSAVPVLFEKLELSLNNLEEWLPDESNEFLKRFQIDWDMMLRNIRDWSNTLVSGIVNTTISTVGSLAGFLINAVLALIFSFYLLLSKEKLMDQFIRLVTTYTKAPTSRRIFYLLTTLDDSFKHFLTGEVIDATILGMLVTLGMWVFRFPYAGMIGALTGVFALVPMLGAYISGTIGMLLISVQSIPQALWFIVFIVVVQQFEGNVVYPRVVGESLGLPGMWVLFAVTIGGGLFGIPGMLLGVPLASATYKIIRKDVKEREKYSLAERKSFIKMARNDSLKQVEDDIEDQKI